MSKYNYDGSSQFKPISAWGYVGYSILFSIPIIGLILLIVFALSSRNINRRSYARSYFCWLLIVIIISVLIATGVVSGLINDSVRAKFTEVQNSVQTFVEKTLGIAPKHIATVSNDNEPSVEKNKTAESESDNSTPTETKPTQKSEAEAPAKSESAATGDMVEVQVGGKTLQIRKSFKDTMDGYESFFNEYINVMEKQDILRMATMVARYDETLEEMDNMKEDDLTDAEMAYYTHVHTQIMEKLLTVGQ